MTMTRNAASAASIAFAAASALALGACGTTPTRFYTLVPPPAAQVPVTARFQIEVQPVDLPPQVASQQMVVRTGTGELVPVDTRRWQAPLGDEMREALSTELSHRLGAHDVYGLANAIAPKGQGVETWRITVKVQRFESALGAYARVDALWTLRRAGDNTIAAACGSSVTETVQPGYEALVEGHQRAVADLADRIAAVLEAAQNSASAVCPAV
ncbi:MAG: membrane integrity-associated transporter subunit PqiC [Nevskiales bacterium]